MKPSFICVALALALSTLSTSPVFAQGGTDARAAFESARAAMQAKRWELAHRIFLGLWEKQRTYDVALHLGQVEYHLQRFRDAATHLAFGLMLLPPREKPEIAERSRALLELCRQEVATLELRVKNKNATVLVDAVTVAEAPLVTDTYVDPGTHLFEVRLDGYVTEKWEGEYTRGSTQQRVVELRPLSSPAVDDKSPATPERARSMAPQQDTPTPVTTSSKTEAWIPVISGGVLSLIGLGAGIGFELLRQTRSDQAARLRERIELLEGRANGCTEPTNSGTVDLCGQLQDRNSDYDAYGKFELAGFALAGSALAATTIYFIVTRPDRAARATAATSGRALRLEPLIDDTSTSLRLSGTF